MLHNNPLLNPLDRASEERQRTPVPQGFLERVPTHSGEILVADRTRPICSQGGAQLIVIHIVDI